MMFNFLKNDIYMSASKVMLLLGIFFGPFVTVMVATGAMVMADFITGIWASKKAGR